MPVSIGSTAPNFTLLSQSGEKVSLNDYLGKKNVVLYFYPKDFTRGCTMEAHSFRDNYAAFEASDTEVIGIASDSVETHKRFAETCGLPFDILSDPDSLVRQMYGVRSNLSAISSRFVGRTTFVIDKNGTIRLVFASDFRPTKHITEALKALSDGTLG